MNVPASSSLHAELAARAQTALAALTNEVPSPCIQRCQINLANGFCCGCWRSLHEIASWKELDNHAKRQVWRETVMRSQIKATR